MRWFITALVTLGSCGLAASEVRAAPEPSPQGRANGFSLRLLPLIGGADLRGHYEIEDSAPGSGTYLELHRRQPVTVYGAALRAGWAWQLDMALVMVGFGYTFGRGHAEVRQTTAQAEHMLDLDPAYDSVGLVLDVLTSNGFAGFDLYAGSGRVDPVAHGPYDVVRASARNGYMLSIGVRARFPRKSWLAGSIGGAYELLGFAPALFAPEWTSGHLLCVRAGLEFDMALLKADAP